MKKLIGLSAPLFALCLSACGSDPAPGPTEQIIVREPGQAAATAPADAAPTASLAATGKAAFGACAACHTVTENGANGVGPNLHGIVGKAAGSVSGFDYSSALADSGITWNSAELDSFLANPTANIPGTTMVAGAVGSADTRAAIIAYLADTSVN